MLTHPLDKTERAALVAELATASRDRAFAIRRALREDAAWREIDRLERTAHSLVVSH